MANKINLLPSVGLPPTDKLVDAVIDCGRERSPVPTVKQRQVGYIDRRATPRVDGGGGGPRPINR